MRLAITLAAMASLLAIAVCQQQNSDAINAMIARQLMMQQFSNEERIRSEGQSGVKQVRVTRSGTRPYFGETWAGGSAAAVHDHANNIRTVGMGEFAAVLNGVEFKTRHNDYRLYMPSKTSKEWDAKDPLPFPDVPPEVSSKQTLVEQIQEMRDYFRAWKDQDDTVRDYKPYFRANLCYLEGAWTKSEAAIEESFDSDRHFLDASTWFDLQEKVRFSSYSGRKSALENYAFLPTKIMNLINGTTPDMAQWNYRILCQPLKDDLPLDKLRVVDDLGSRMKFHRNMDSHAKSRTARFQLNPLPTGDNWKKHEVFSRKGLLDELMEQIPGKDNGPANIADEVFGHTATKAFDGGELNAGYYHRWFEFGQEDAMGLKVQRRGYSDDQLFMAMTTNPKVAGQSTEKCEWTGRGKNRVQTCATWMQRWSWAIPLEIIYLTPLHSWNPYNIVSKGEARDKTALIQSVTRDASTGISRNGGKSPEKAYDGTHSTLHYITPDVFYSGQEVTPDAADTSRNGAVGVLDRDGVVRLVRAAGTRIILPAIPGVGQLRTRYPIMPVHVEGNPMYKELEALKDVVMRSQTYSYMFREQASGGTGGTGGNTQDGGHTYLMAISQSTVVAEHRHSVVLSAAQITKLSLGENIFATTSTDNGHEHYLNLVMKSAGPGKNVISYIKCGSKGRCWDGHGRILKQEIAK